MNEFLIVDCVGSGTMVLNESKGNGKLLFQGKFQEYGKINKNRRMYTEAALRANVERLQDLIKTRRLVGELDHPSDSIVHLEKASHLVTKLWWEGNVLMGEGEVLPTAAGKHLKALLEADVGFGISSRGVGSGDVNEEGVLIIGQNYKLITFDVVADPSTQGAFQKKVVSTESSIPVMKDPVVIEPIKRKTMSPSLAILAMSKLLEHNLSDVKRRIRG